MPLNDELLAHHISTVKHGAEVGNTVKPYLDAMKSIVRKSVAGFDSDKRTRARLEKLLEKLAKDLEVPSVEYRKELIKQLREFARYEARYQADTIGGWVNVDLVTPTVEQVWAAAKFEPLKLASSPIDFDSLINSWGSDEVSRLVMGVKSGFVEGLTTRQIIKNVVGDGGLADISQRNAMANGRTLVMHLANEARFATYQENDDVVIGYTWVSTLDSRTSDICRSRDGQVYLFKDKNQPKPPAHYNCRSTTAPKLSPEFDIFDQGATRASNGADGGKQVAADTTYYDWLKRQPASYQDEVLGKTKGMIFRNSGLDAEEFRKLSVDNLGRPLTIDEMAAADKRVAGYMAKSGSAPKAEYTAKTNNEFIAKSDPISSVSKESAMKPPKVDSMVSVPDVQQEVVSAPKKLKLTSEQIGAVEYYKGDGFYNDNMILRNPSNFDASQVALAKVNANRINSAIAASKTTSDHVFYRGIRSSELFDSAESLIGGEIINNTVQSTTYAKGMAKSYAGLISDYTAAPGKSVLLKINTPKGSSALNVSDLTSINSSEKEVLLSAGSKYRVVRVINHGQYKEIEVDYVEGNGKI